MVHSDFTVESVQAFLCPSRDIIVLADLERSVDVAAFAVNEDIQPAARRREPDLEPV
jgi:hypothetical protein